MKIKVQCLCGSRFEFEVEPVNGRMPVSINCPVCNADDTELANAIIQQQSGVPAVGIPIGIAAAPVMPPTPVAAPAAPAPPQQSSLRISKPAAAHAPPPPTAAPAYVAASADAGVPLCPKHPEESAVDACVVCHKPICPKCMEQFGHVCSVYCRQQATQQRIYVPAYANQRSVVEQKSRGRTKLIVSAVSFLVIAVLGLWFWYVWFARNPKVVYSLTFGTKDDSRGQRAMRKPEYYKLIAPNQLFSIKDKQASLLDVLKQQSLWTTPLASATEAAAKPKPGKKTTEADEPGAEEDFGFYSPHVFVSTNDIWLEFGNKLVRLDRQTGTRKDSAIPGKILTVYPGESSLVAVTLDTTGQRSLVRLNFQDGNVQTAPIGAPPAVVKPIAKTAVKAAANKKIASTNNAARAATVNSGAKMDQLRAATNLPRKVVIPLPAADDSELMASSPLPDDDADNSITFEFGGGEYAAYTATGQNVAQFQTKLLEQKTITHQAMKAKGKSVLEGNVTASQGLDLAQEMMNDSQRDLTGGVDIEDVSRYQATIHRWFADNVPDWTGEVTGPPKFAALKTVDVLVAGQTAIAFDRNNKKLWEGKLTYPMGYLGEHPPMLETADTLYIADPGVLTCFDLATGNVRWRLNSVGISSIQVDAKGKLYLITTTAGPESIKFSQQHNIHEKIHPVLMKVDPASGKVLWRQESIGDQCIVSGKFLYTTWITHVQSALKLEEGPDTHFNLNLLDPSNGYNIWNYHVGNQMLMDTEVQQNWIMLRFEDKLLVLKFFSL